MSRTRWAIGLAALACLGIASTIYATGYGTGLIADSQSYLDAARSLLQGQGFSVRTAGGVSEPLTNWPPLFSTSLAALGLLGLDLRGGARWLNAALLGGTVVLGMLAIRRVANGSTAAAIFGGVLLATSIDLLTVHSQAGSEPLFLLFGLLGLILTALHIERPSPYRLLGASIATALAFLTRYPGIVLIAAGVVGLLLFDRRTWWQRARDAVVFAGVSAFPMFLWMIRNWRSAKQPIGSFRVLEVHPLTRAQLRIGLDTVSGWVMPGHELGNRFAELLGPIPGLRWIVLIGALVVGGLAGRSWFVRSRRGVGTEPLFAPPLLRLLATFILLYLAFMVVSMSFFDASIPLDQRLLSPVFMTGVILVVGVGARMAVAFRGSRVARAAIMVGCLGLAVLYADTAGRWIRRAHENGLGYASKSWQESDILRKVEGLPADKLMYSNGPDVVFLVADRLALELPRKVPLNTGQPNPTYEAELAAMVSRLRAGAVLVHLRQVTWRTALYGSETELEQRLHLRVQQPAVDGAIYDVAP